MRLWCAKHPMKYQSFKEYIAKSASHTFVKEFVPHKARISALRHRAAFILRFLHYHPPIRVRFLRTLLAKWYRNAVNKAVRAGRTCTYCGFVGNMTVDHFVPLSKNGTSQLVNYLPACKFCNLSKAGKRYSEFRKSYLCDCAKPFGFFFEEGKRSTPNYRERKLHRYGIKNKEHCLRAGLRRGENR